MYNLIQTVSTQTPKCFLSDLYPLLDITTILTFIVLILLFFILFFTTYVYFPKEGRQFSFVYF
jgi:hypothetical protein